jgi:hypothetical protein
LRCATVLNRQHNITCLVSRTSFAFSYPAFRWSQSRKLCLRLLCCYCIQYDSSYVDPSHR